MAEKYSFKTGVEVGQVPRRSSVVYVTNEAHAVALADRAIIYTLTGTAAVTCTLPPVGLAEGLTITIRCLLRSDTAVLTVADRDDSGGWADLTVDETDDGLVLYSDGITWWVLFDNLS